MSGNFLASLNLDYDLFEKSNYNANVKPPTVNVTSGSTDFAVYGDSSAVYNVANFNTSGDNVYNINIVGSGNTFSFRLEEKSTNPSYSLDTAIFEYRTNERK